MKHLGIRRNTLSQPCTSSDDAMMANNCLPTQNRCPCINHHAILDRWLSFFILQILFYCQRPQRHTLIQFDIIANYCCLSNHHSRPMINAEISADLRSWMNVNPSFRVSRRCNHSGDQGYLLFVELMCHSMES